MKKIISVAKHWLLVFIFRAVYYFPLWSGYLFLLVVAVSGIAVLFFQNPLAVFYTVLNISWKVYLVGVVLTLFVMIAFCYRHCCYMLHKFSTHLAHAEGKHFETLFISIIWPMGWWMVAKNMAAWGMDWMGIVVPSLLFWLPGRRQLVVRTIESSPPEDLLADE